MQPSYDRGRCLATRFTTGLRIEPTPGPTTLRHLRRVGRSHAPQAAARDLPLDATRPPAGAIRRHRHRAQPDGRRGVPDAVPRQPEGVCRRRTPVRDEVAESLASRMYYVAGETDDPELYQRLQARLTEINGAEGVLYYLAIPPTVYVDGHRAAGTSGLADAPARGWRRIIVEKPFGTDLDSARALNRLAHQHFDEEQVYRIDHYLGKETVQNLLVFRFGNGMFEPIWNRRYIDHVQITAAETVGVEHRAAYYEGAGALRDMVQNHLMQVLSLVAMEPPIAFTAESVRDRKMDALLAVQPLVTNGADGEGSRRPRGPRAVPGGVGERRRGAGLPRREGRRADIDDRDVRRRSR